MGQSNKRFKGKTKTRFLNEVELWNKSKYSILMCLNCVDSCVVKRLNVNDIAVCTKCSENVNDCCLIYELFIHIFSTASIFVL